MSLLSSKRLVVAVHKRGIDALHVKEARLPLLPAAVLDEQRIDVVTVDSGDTGTTAIDSPSWQNSLALLRDLDKTRGIRNLHLVLSNHFVRYMLLPWESVVDCHGNTQSLARAHFQLAFGDASSAWHVTAEAPRFRSSCLAAAVDIQLIETAKKIAADAGWQIAGVRPHLLTALKSWRANMRQRANKGPAWFAVFEPGRLSVLGCARGSGMSLHNVRLHAPEALMPTLLQCVMADRLKTVHEGPVFLHAPGWSNHVAETHPTVTRLDGMAQERFAGAESDFGRAMAYSGRV